MLGATFIALFAATILLAVAAAGGVHAYIGVYFIIALLFSGLRFTDQGAPTSVVVMLTSLNTMSFASVAEEKGLGYVASLWTESDGMFRNSIIGMCWISVCLAFPRLIPPSKTARNAFTRKLLPKVSKDVASFIHLTVANHNIKGDIEDVNDSDDDAESNADGNDDAGQKSESIEDMIMKIVQDCRSHLLVEWLA